MRKLLAVLGMALPLYGQYAGPAILSRGESPAAMNGPEISFRPFVDVSGVYSTGLASSVAVNSQGDIANSSAGGVSFAGGISGSHRWKYTTLGLSYRASYAYYPRNGGYGGFNQSMLFSIGHQISRHVTVGWNNSFGVINRDYGLLTTISPSVNYDPSQNFYSTNNFFDNRSVIVSSQGNLTLQRSTRMSFGFGGGIFTNLYSSAALYGVFGVNVRADMMYRINRSSTLGVAYNYSHFGFSQTQSDTNLQGASVNFGSRLSHWWEFSGYGGFFRVETKFLQNVPVDPAIAAIIGITESSEVVYSVRYVPNVGARLSRVIHNGVVYVSGGHTVIAGNGLFLTSGATNVSGGYAFTGLRRWGIGAHIMYTRAQSIGNVVGNYGGMSGGLNASRQITRGMNFTSSLSVLRYNSPDFSKYNSTVYSVGVGLGWAPGNVPLRIW